MEGRIKTKKWLRKTSITGIYKITSPSGRVYIGQSWDIKNRWRLHRSMPSRGCKMLHNSFKKYGTETHLFNILHSLPSDISQSILDEYEIFYINHFKECGIRLMNLKDGGGNAKSTEARKKKMSEFMKGNSWGFKKGHIPWSVSAKGTLVAWNKGLKGVLIHSDETKNKISKALKGKRFPNKCGKKMSEKNKEALRKVNTGRKMPQHLVEILSKYRPENGRRTGLLNRGKKRTEENKEKIRQTLRNRIDNKGEYHPKAKLTMKMVEEIREKYIPRTYTSRMLAQEYNISKTNILDIVNNKIWIHAKDN